MIPFTGKPYKQKTTDQSKETQSRSEMEPGIQVLLSFLHLPDIRLPVHQQVT